MPEMDRVQLLRGRALPEKLLMNWGWMEGQRVHSFEVSVWTIFRSVIQPSRVVWDLMSSCGWCVRSNGKRGAVVMCHNQRTCLQLGPHS